MNSEFDKNYDVFTKCVLVGLFCGISAVYINLAFDMIFRYETRLNLSAIINVSSIIMGCVLLLVFCGVFYYGFKRLFKGAGEILYSVVFIALTVFCVYKISGLVVSDNVLENIHWKEEASVLMIVNGTLAAIFIPFFYKKDNLISKVI